MSAAHRECFMKWNHHVNGQAVDVQLNAEKQKQQRRNSEALEKIVTTLLYLARQGQSFRGHDEEEGNFKQLLRLRSADSAVLSEWLNGSQRNKWTSHDVQNELLRIMSHAVIRNIVRCVTESRFFAVIGDESTDISGMQQFSITLRHVTHQFAVREDFIGLYEVEQANAEQLSSLVLDCFIRLNLDVHHLRGQGYDGAAVMAGARNGVAAKIAQREPRAVYMHCAGHTLNLALQDASKHVTLIREVLDIIRELINFMRDSPKRCRLFDEVKSQLPELDESHLSRSMSLRPLCPTRWTVRTASLSSVSTNYTALLQTLNDITTQCRDDSGAKAAGFLRQLESFDIWFGVQLALLVFEPTEQCSRILQTKNISAVDAKNAAIVTNTLLQSLRNDAKFNSFYDNCVEQAETIGVEQPILKRQIRRPGRFEDGAPAYHPQTCRDKFRQIYNQFVDSAVTSIADRFDNPAYTLFAQIESTLIQSANGTVSEKDVSAICAHFGDDLQLDKLSRQLGVLTDLCRGRGQRITSINQLLDKFVDLGPAVNLLDAVNTLLRLFFVLPASVASAERSFSAMRRMKTYLRSTMTSERLNSVMVLHVNKELTDALRVSDIMREFISFNDTRKDTFGQVA
jgi:hypothetical protein